MNLGAASVLALAGTSILTGTAPFQIARPVAQRVRHAIAPNFYAPPTWPPRPVVESRSWPPAPVIASGAWPPAVSNTGGALTVANYAVGGANSTDTKAQVTAAIAGNSRITSWITDGGFINDINQGVPLATTLANLTDMLDAIDATGADCVVAGPIFYGEKHPSGENPAGFDDEIDAMDTAAAAVVAGYPRFSYVSQRQDFYAVQEPIWNTAAHGFSDPHGDTAGPFTPREDANHVHPIGQQEPYAGQPGGGAYYAADVINAEVHIV